MIKMPVSYKEFKKDPVKALLFITLSAIGYLYIDNKMNYQDQVEICQERTVELEDKVDKLTYRMMKSDSSLAVAATKLKVLAQLNKIEDI
jgi:predicted regulator of amino acid metabolism with ACT domain